jgi:hypothetical protein
MGATENFESPRALSKSFFNSIYRIELVDTIAAMPRAFTREDIEKRSCSIPRTSVVKELSVLVEHGFLRRTSQPSPTGRKPYERTRKFTSLRDFIERLLDDRNDSTHADGAIPMWQSTDVGTRRHRWSGT